MVIALGALSRAAPGIGEVDTKVFAIAAFGESNIAPIMNAMTLNRFMLNLPA